MGGRERILADGPQALSEAELLSLLLGVRRQRAAEELLSDGLAALRRARAGDLVGVGGVGLAQACRVIAGVELGVRVACAPAARRSSARQPKDLAALLWPRLAGLVHEEFWAVLLSARLHVLRTVRVAAGGLTACSVLPREAFAPALLHGAPAVAFAHNHPSGEPQPSPDDQRLESRLDEVGRALGIQVVDHLVLADRGVHSAREGLLAPLSLVSTPAVG